MTGSELFERLADAGLPALLRDRFENPNVCIVTTRIVLDVAEYFGVAVEPITVRAVAYNAAFAKHVDEGFTEGRDPKAWNDGSWSVGVGYGYAEGQSRANGWDGHLIAYADGHVADFSVGQLERPAHDLIIGSHMIAEVSNLTEAWAVHLSSGSVVEYERIDSREYIYAKDWRDNRRRRLSAALIRTLKR